MTDRCSDPTCAEHWAFIEYTPRPRGEARPQIYRADDDSIPLPDDALDTDIDARWPHYRTVREGREADR